MNGMEHGMEWIWNGMEMEWTGRMAMATGWPVDSEEHFGEI